jgi:hypothetical protein
VSATLEKRQIEFPHIVELALFQNRSADKRIRRARGITAGTLLLSCPKLTAAAGAPPRCEVVSEIFKSAKA